MNADWMKTRQTKYSAYVTVYVLVVVALLAGLNYLASVHNKSVDLTSNKRYTLSDQTIKIVKNLKDEVDIYYFDETKQFPAAQDLLDRYNNLSTKLKIQYVDPYKKPQMAREFGVHAAGTIILQHGTRRSEARSLTEEEITSALIHVLKSGERMACFVGGAGEHALAETGAEDYSGVKDALEKNNYKTDTINLLEKPEIPASCTVVVVAGPRYEYPQPVVDALKNYIEKGGRGLFMLDPPLDAGKDKIAANDGLVKVLSGWGVTLNKDQVLDTSGIGGLYGLGPEVALANKYGSHPIVKEMKGSATAFAIVRSLDAKAGPNTSAETIVSTTNNSFATTQLSGKERKVDLSKGERKSFPVAAAGTYRVPATGSEVAKEGRFVVVGSSDWAANYVLRFAANRDFFLNIVSWLSNDEDLISIRPKEPEDRRIQLTRAQMMMVRLVSQFVIPLIVILAGILVWLKRR
jgi:ABC-type uncharacterized transport system involved in gliding motility auxiliary subunit